jgi:hypothetical protein
VKPPRRPDNIHTPGGLVEHLEQVNKTLSSISFGNTTLSTLSTPAVGASSRILDADRNIEGDKFIATSPAAPNTEFTVNHSLGRVPHGFIYLGGSNPGTVYRGASAWSSTQVFFKETQGSNTFVFILV